MVQQRRGTVQDRPRQTGVGRTPPAVAFDVVNERAPSEDAHVLFEPDSVSISLGSGDLAGRLPQLSGATRPLIVDIDGYASTEGDADYNLNLSAHRAAALLPLLPGVHKVRLHAHGATAEFGEDAASNRRVGIRVVESPAQSASPSAASPSSLASRFRLVPDLQLHIDPSLLPRPPIQPATRDPGLTSLTPQPDLVDWPALRQTFADHGGGVIDPRTAAAAEVFTRHWYQVYRQRLSEDDARSLANFGTRIVVGRELAGEGSTPVDRFDNELQRRGLPKPIGGSVDLLDLWRRLRR